MWYNRRMTKRKRLVVALRLAGVAGQEKLAGIFRYLSETYGDDAPYDMRLFRTKAEFSPDALRAEMESGAAGYIVSIPETETTAKLLAGADLPTVVMDIPAEPLGKRTKNLVFIRNSAGDIGREAARYLIGQGVARDYAFLHAVDAQGVPSEWSLNRLRAFAETLRDNGLWCTELYDAEDAAKLRRPAAVLAANDDCAFKLVERLRARRLRIPQDIAVLGVDNEALICENCHPRLSSVQPDFEHEGYTAAKLVDEMLKGKAMKRTVLLVGVKTIVRRESTAELSTAGRLVQKAVAYIDRNATKGIGVADVVKHLKCSRRLADLRFRQLQGRTILEAITERRLDEVKRLLLATDDRIDEIAAACGYANGNYLKNLFRKRLSMSMREFRQQSRPENTGGRYCTRTVRVS